MGKCRQTTISVLPPTRDAIKARAEAEGKTYDELIREEFDLEIDVSA